MDQAVTQKIPRQNKYLKIIIGIFIVLAILYFGGGYFINGSLNGCPYTEQTLSTPTELQDATLITNQDMPLAQGKNSEHCTAGFKNVSNEIISPEVEDWLGNSYNTNDGRTIIPLPKGQKFQIEKVIAETKHGFSAIDSGSGPSDWLILRDEKGQQYMIAVIYLEQINTPNTKYFSYTIGNQAEQSLTENIFK